MENFMSKRVLLKSKVGLSALLFTLINGLIVGGCGSQPETFSPTNTDRFVNHDEELYTQASSILAADYLFVIDPSYSVKNEQPRIESTLNSFMDHLENASPEVDYRIGFLNGNFQATVSDSPIPDDQGTALIGNNFLFPGFSANSGILQDLIDYIGQPLTPNRTVPLETTARFITKQKSSFVRSGAQLIYVFITDTDDKSHQVAGGHTGAISASHYYVTQLKKAKTDPAYVSARAIVSGNFNGVNGGCTGTTGKRVYDTAFFLNQSSSAAGPHNYCIKQDLDLNLNSLAVDVTKPTTRFQLLQRPVNNKVTVIVDNVEVPAVDKLVTPNVTNWKYVSSTNEVVFQPGKQPAPTAQLELKYDILFALSATPVADTIQVQVNGSVVDDSQWDYVPSENRIQFASKPPTDAEVLIGYEIQ
jgi:hypothetical protein